MIAIILGKNLAVPRHSQGGRERRFDIGLYETLSCGLDADNLKEWFAVVPAYKLQGGVEDDIHAEEHETEGYHTGFPALQERVKFAGHLQLVAEYADGFQFAPVHIFGIERSYVFLIHCHGLLRYTLFISSADALAFRFAVLLSLSLRLTSFLSLGNDIALRGVTLAGGIFVVVVQTACVEVSTDIL